MSYRHFVEQVRDQSGTDDSARIERAIQSTLEVLGERLAHPDARAVAKKLPPELGSHLCAKAHAGAPIAPRPKTTVREVCDEAGVATTELRAICRVLAETLDEQGRAQLRMQPLSALFVH